MSTIESKRPVTTEELLISSLVETDTLAKLLIEKGLSLRPSYWQRSRRSG